MRQLLSAAVLTAAAMVLVTGCGGGGSSTTTGEGGKARLSHAEWVAQADAICSVDHEANAKREGEFEALLQGGLASAKAREEAAELIRAAVPNVETEVEGIRALRPASDDEAEVAKVVIGLERTTRLDEKFAEALESGSVDELDAVIAMVGANGTRLEGLAGELGTKVCGKPGAGAGAEEGAGEPGRGEWVNHANEICRTTREANTTKLEEFDAVSHGGLKTPRERHEGAAIIRAGIANVEAEIDSFRAIVVPTAQKGEFEKLIADLEAVVGVESEIADNLDRGELEAIAKSLEKVVKAELAVRGLALHLGLRVCGKLLQAEGGHSLA